MDKLIYNWNNKIETKKSDVKLHDETLRDGLQAPYIRHPNCKEKIHLVSLMENLGIFCANVGFPASSVEQKRDILAIAKEKREKGWKISLMCAARTKIEDISPVVEISQKSGVLVEVGVFIGSSNIRKLVEKWNLKEMGRRVKQSIQFARKNNLEVMFVTEDTTRAHPSTIKYLYKTAMSYGARKLCISDTVGIATPTGVRRLLGFFSEEVINNSKRSGLLIEWHGHQDRGLALVNTLVAIENNVNVVEATALGVGERSGNTPMEILLANLWVENLLEPKPEIIQKYARFAAKILNFRPAVNHPIIGKEAFSTGAGVHAAAVLKALELGRPDLANKVYTGIDSSLVGRKQKFGLTKMSGKSNVLLRLKELKIKYDKEVTKKLLLKAKKSTKPLTNKDIRYFLKELKEASMPV